MPKHSKEFIATLEQASPSTAIRAITHARPMMVFWIAPDGKILDAKEAHHDNPPYGDRSVLSSPTHRGCLRGRAALIGPVLYVVVYGDNRDKSLTARQLRLLKHAQGGILGELKRRGASDAAVAGVQFIQEDGSEIPA